MQHPLYKHQRLYDRHEKRLWSSADVTGFERSCCWDANNAGILETYSTSWQILPMLGSPLFLLLGGWDRFSIEDFATYGGLGGYYGSAIKSKALMVIECVRKGSAIYWDEDTRSYG
jgi:hypothetical protein